jgi:isoleucyl-tRNA synthetase
VVQRAVRPKPALLGPRLGPRFPSVLQALREGSFILRDDGAVEVGGELLAPEEVQVSSQAQAGFAAYEADGYTLVLDTTLTPELISAGRAREVVHRIQTMRKDAGLDVEDRIVTVYEASEALAPVFRDHADYIQQETLSVALRPHAEQVGHVWSGDLDGEPLQLSVARANGTA